MGCKTEKGLPLSLTQASDEQLRTTLMEVENKYFSQCKNPEIQERMCKAAREISFKQLQLFRNGAQGVISTPGK
jgi:hypothetical protein